MGRTQGHISQEKHGIKKYKGVRKTSIYYDSLKCGHVRSKVSRRYSGREKVICR